MASVSVLDGTAEIAGIAIIAGVAISLRALWRC
jgi:hypothetical protein